VIHLDPVGRLVLKDQIMIDQLKDPLISGMFKQQKETGIRGEVPGREFNIVDHIDILWGIMISDTAF
jgi:hypothetical protein